MHYRKLGASDFEVSALSFGAWQIGDAAYWTSDTVSDHERAVHAALDAGINLFDTAEMYGAGESEAALGRALGARRAGVFVASKVLPDHCAPEQLRAACEASLQRLNTDYIDLYQIHWPFRHVPFDAAYAELDRLRSEGKIRAIGVSNFGPQDLAAWLEVGDCVSDQVGYNLAFRAVEYEITPACIAAGVGMLAYVPLLQGILTGRWKSGDEIPAMRRRTRHFAASRSGVMHEGPGHERMLFELVAQLDAMSRQTGHTPAALSLAWLMARPGVTSVILGARNVDQLQRNLAAADLVLSRELTDRLDAVSAPLKEAIGPNADMWKEGTEARIR